jgi:RimJ/RimL family protein N-acetyltransferase
MEVSRSLRAVPAPWLTTARLCLREFAVTDFDDLYRLDSDRQVMQYVNGGRGLTRSEVRHGLSRMLASYPHYPGLGIWRAARRVDDAFVGWFCLKYCPPTCDVEVGYRLLPEAWGQGLATEGASALVAHGLRDLLLFRVIGVTHPDNKASQRVLVKSGLADCGWGRYYDKRVRLFVADAERTSVDPRRAAAALPDLGAFPDLLREATSLRAATGG